MVACAMGLDTGQDEQFRGTLLDAGQKGMWDSNTVLQVLPGSVVVRGLNHTHQWNAIALFLSSYKHCP